MVSVQKMMSKLPLDNEKKSFYSSQDIALRKFWHWKRAIKISQKLLQLVA